MSEKSFPPPARPILRDICAKFRLHKALPFMPLTPMRPSFGANFPQIVTYIWQKAFFRHALEYRKDYGSFGELLDIGDTSGKTMYGPKNIHQPEERERFLDFWSLSRLSWSRKGISWISGNGKLVICLDTIHPFLGGCFAHTRLDVDASTLYIYGEQTEGRSAYLKIFQDE